MPKSSLACDVIDVNNVFMMQSITLPPKWCVSEFKHFSGSLQCRQQVHCGFGKSSSLKSYRLEKHFLEMSSCHGQAAPDEFIPKQKIALLQNHYAFDRLLHPKWQSQSLTITAVLFCFLLVVLDEQLSLSASRLTALCQLVQNLHCACVHLKLWYRLLPEHLPEPLAHLLWHSICKCTVNGTCMHFEIQESIFICVKWFWMTTISNYILSQTIKNTTATGRVQKHNRDKVLNFFCCFVRIYHIRKWFMRRIISSTCI